MQTYRREELNHTIITPYKYKPQYDYVVRQNTNNHFTIVKFLDADVVARYDVTLKPWSCSCASGMYRGYCKHRQMVQDFFKNYGNLNPVAQAFVQLQNPSYEKRQ